MTKKYTIVADENMPHIDAFFAEFAEIIKLPGREINNCDVKNADAILCRSITTINPELLTDSKVQFVATATIGTDHLAIDWLDQNNIAWASAAGCNAAAVAQYVISAICFWLKKNQVSSSKTLHNITVGIVGAGNVGTELARCLDILNVSYYLCDPPLKNTGDKRKLVDLKKIKGCDVISLHVPSIITGEHKTYHLVDEHFLNTLSQQQLLINAARGSVVDNAALLAYLKPVSKPGLNSGPEADIKPNKQTASVILDVFENEPNINPELARHCLLATPHIAGHTLEGKLRGSYMVYQAFCRHFNLPIAIQSSQLFPEKNSLVVNVGNLMGTLLIIYDIQKDSQKFLSVDDITMPMQFDKMRKNYVTSFDERPRRDYSGWQVARSQMPMLTKLLADETKHE